MQLDHLIDTINNISWLSNSGSLSELLAKDEDWEWLPTSRDCNDPFRCQYSRSPAESGVYKTTLKSLRSIGESSPNLVVGPHDYTNAFKGAALYTFKMATREIAGGNPDRWSELAAIYQSGKWPLGVTPSGHIIVL